ncbi:Calx-beta domain-containing protein [Maribacter aurantiacus]|uniref:T9SS type A sorting domain-containing protein n=1 Tax=Maribacter aurantiacus TaxID=1882343 RepID=A0A5R8M4Y3_9FLAO|nr:T9SS type A sorting domain-containing protein [Maribacter aurantiacus]TLF44662.1 T9SS type A sorting domain-containing protein [Maribacter aurantiacus]
MRVSLLSSFFVFFMYSLFVITGKKSPFDNKSGNSFIQKTHEFDVAILNNGAPLTSSLTVIDISCFGSNDGQIQVAASGGTGPYQYELLDSTGSFVLVPSQSTSVFVNLGPGDYLVRVVDTDLSNIDAIATINEPLPISTTILKNDTCSGVNNGSLEITVSGGSPNYEHSLDGVTFLSSNVFENLSEGTYEVYTRDSMGCFIMDSITINGIDCSTSSLQMNSDISVNEADDLAIFEVVLNGNAPGGFTVDYAVNNGSALSPDDFSSSNGTLSFAGNDGEVQNISVLINDDNLLESTEDFTVVISNVTVPEISISDATAVGTIIDNDSSNCEIIEIIASDGSTGELFGKGSAISPDERTIAVASYYDNENGYHSGSVYIYEKQANGSWIETQKLFSMDIEAEDIFGFSLTFSNEELFIGAYGKNSSTGAVYVFQKDVANLWNETQKLEASDAYFSDHFGYSLSVFEDNLFIGAPNDDDTAINTGSVYVFEKVNNNWSEKQKLVSLDPETYNGFGISVDVYEDTAIIGSWYSNDLGDNSGVAYLFTRNNTGTWVQHQKILPNDGLANEFFGRKVAISNDTVLVSSLVNFQGPDWDGAAYVFNKDVNNVWTQTTKLVPDDLSTGDRFAESISIEDNFIVIGASRDDDGATSSGSIYTFKRDGNGEWAFFEKFTNCTPSEYESFGDTMVATGSLIVVGTYLVSEMGSAHIIEVDKPEVSPLVVNSTEVNSVSCSGETNGSLLVNVEGGTQPYVFYLQDTLGNPVASAQSSGKFSNLASGYYHVVIEDVNGLSEAILIEIGEPSPLQYDIFVTNIICENAADASIEIINTTGGSGIYSYSLNSSDISSSQTESLFENLTEGTYTVSVFDANGCISVSEVAITTNFDNSDFDQDGISDSCDDDIDGDGILNALDQCQETPLGSLVNSDGCEMFTLPVTNFSVQTNGETCATSDNGSLLVTAVENLGYTATLSTEGGVIESKTFRTFVSFQNLMAGNYDVCILVDDEPGFERCYSVQITEPEHLDVIPTIDPNGKSITLKMKGGTNYRVAFNDQIYFTSESEITIPITKGKNQIAVHTDIDCQGVFEKEFTIEGFNKILAYPNPVSNGEISLYFSNTIADNISVSLFNNAGMEVYQNTFADIGSSVTLDVSNISSGVYNLLIETESKTESLRIIIE